MSRNKAQKSVAKKLLKKPRGKLELINLGAGLGLQNCIYVRFFSKTYLCVVNCEKLLIMNFEKLEALFFAVSSK